MTGKLDGTHGIGGIAKHIAQAKAKKARRTPITTTSLAAYNAHLTMSQKKLAGTRGNARKAILQQIADRTATVASFVA
jgi:hypothetical protein